MAKSQAIIAKAESDVRTAELRAAGEQARLEFEQEKGLNKAERDAESGTEPEIDAAKLEPIVKRLVAKELAAKK